MKVELMKKERSNPIPSALQAELDTLASLPDSQIQTSDIPEVRDWSGAKRGALYRPQKQEVILRLDADLVQWFETHHIQEGERLDAINGAMNNAWREHVAQQAV